MRTFSLKKLTVCLALAGLLAGCGAAPPPDARLWKAPSGSLPPRPKVI